MTHTNTLERRESQAGSPGETNQALGREPLHLRFDSDEGAIGYILLWLMGVPASILFLAFLLRGCD